MVSVLTRGGDAVSTATVSHSANFQNTSLGATSLCAILVILIVSSALLSKPEASVPRISSALIQAHVKYRKEAFGMLIIHLETKLREELSHGSKAQASFVHSVP